MLPHADCRSACADRRRVTADDWDEYEDEDDPGYVREDIRGQDAFAARELDASDADGGRRAMDLYHQAVGPLRAGAPPSHATPQSLADPLDMLRLATL